MNACQAFRRTFQVGPHQVMLKAEVVAGKPVSIEIHWNPTPRRLSERLIQEYVAKRNAAIQAMATELGIPSVAVIAPGLGEGATLIQPDADKASL